MSQASPASSPFEFVASVESFYAALMQGRSADMALGGALLYAGALEGSSRALVAAASVAGAASLAAAPEIAAQRMAVREGAADFLVTSLDEALRILKNEIRKHAAVSVCVAQSPSSLQAEMQERGVAPDLVAQDVAVFADVPRVAPLPLSASQVQLQWRAASMPALWMPRLDEMARATLPADDAHAERWLRLAPRYCGRAAAQVRVLRCSPPVAQEFTARVQAAVASGHIGVPVEIHMQEN